MQRLFVPTTISARAVHLWLALLLLVAGLAGCGAQGDTQSGGQTGAAQPKTVRIGYQKFGTLTVLKAQGQLEQRLQPQGITVEWLEFPGGPQLLEALNTGSPDLVQLTLEELAKVEDWVKSKPVEAAALLAPQVGIKQPTLERVIARTIYGVDPVDETVVGDQQKIADVFFKLQLIPKEIKIKDATLPRIFVSSAQR